MEIKEMIRPGMEMVVEQNEISDTYTIGNLKEVVTITGDEKKHITRTIYNGNVYETEKSAMVSKEYLPLPALYNLGLMMQQPEFEELYDNVSTINLEKNGTLKFVWKEEIMDQEVPVLDVQQIVTKTDRKRGNFSLDEFQITNGKMEKAFPMYMVTNSFDRTKAVQIVAGLYRFVCSNGLIVPSHFGGEEFGEITKYKHYQSLQLDIDEAIIRGMQQIINAGAKVEWAKKLYRMELTDTTKTFLLENLTDMLEAKRKLKTYKQYAPAVESTFQFFFKLIPRMQNLLDFENVLSYMVATPNGMKRFPTMVQVLCREIEKKVIELLK